MAMPAPAAQTLGRRNSAASYLAAPRARTSVTSHASNYSRLGGAGEPRPRMSTVTRADSVDPEDLVIDDTPRGKVTRVLENAHFDYVMGFVVITNIVIMILETNAKAPCASSKDDSACKEEWLTVMNMIFQVIYTVECCSRLFAYRKSFFKSKWNLLDFVIVILGWVDLIFTEAVGSADNVPGPSVAILRLFRVGRLLRIVRILSFFPELYLMIRGFMGAMMAMFWGMVLISGLLVIWSLLAVELINPINHEINHGNDWCITSFSSVYLCILFFFQTVFAGDSWGTCAVPIIRDSWWTITIFAGALITIQLGFTNLVLAVIVERATSVQMKDADQRHKEKLEKHRQNSDNLRHVLNEIDKDNSGTLSVQELVSGYNKNKDLQRLLLDVDVGEADLRKMAELLKDDHGDAEIEEFVENIERCESDLPRQILFMNLQIGNIKRQVEYMKSGGLPVTNSDNEDSPTKKAADLPATSAKFPKLPDGPHKAALTELQAESERFQKSLQALQERMDQGWSALAQQIKMHSQEQSTFLTKQMEVIASMSSTSAATATTTTTTTTPAAPAATSPQAPPSSNAAMLNLPKAEAKATPAEAEKASTTKGSSDKATRSLLSTSDDSEKEKGKRGNGTKKGKQ